MSIKVISLQIIEVYYFSIFGARKTVVVFSSDLYYKEKFKRKVKHKLVQISN